MCSFFLVFGQNQKRLVVVKRGVGLEFFQASRQIVLQLLGWLVAVVVRLNPFNQPLFTEEIAIAILSVGQAIGVKQKPRARGKRLGMVGENRFAHDSKRQAVRRDEQGCSLIFGSQKQGAMSRAGRNQTPIFN